VVLESAYFHPTWIRKSARRHGLSTDASFRFERGIDPNEVIYNLKLAAMLVKEIAGGEICGDIVDVKAHDFPGFPVELRYDYVTGLIGKDIPHDEIRNIVKSLEMEITHEDNEKMNLVVPTYRVDVRRPCDVVEDILRVYGYNNIEMTNDVHSSLSNKTEVDFADDMQETVSNQLSSIGYHEIMNNSLTVGAYYEGLTTYPADRCVRIMNPLSGDLNVMRQTLLFGGLESIARNINHKNPNLRLYEFGNVYSHDANISQEEKALAPYSESTQMGMWLTGNNHDESWADKVRALTVYDLKSDLENVLANMGIDLKDLVIEQCEDETVNPALRYCNRGGKAIAVMGVVDEALAKKFDVDQPVYYAQINWNLACKVARKRDIKYSDLPKTLPLRRDLALLVDREVTYDDIRRVVEASEKKLLKSMSLFDVYESNKLEAGKKSYAISMILQDNEKTLNDKQIDAIMNKIIKNLETQLGAKLR
jgi:phenylalanyl-tRNA synthetase beta chain